MPDPSTNARYRMTDPTEAMGPYRVLELAGPECCGTVMVHNSFTGMYECAAAYYYLLDEELLTDVGELRDWREPSPTELDRELYAHWRASWVPDGWDV